MSTCDFPVHGDAVDYSRLSQWQNIDLNVSKPLRLTSLLSAPSAMWNLVCWQDTCIELEGSGIVSSLGWEWAMGRAEET
jgi:hypothetical protein